jgi:hypothetical protein
MANEVNEVSMILGELRAHNQTAKETSLKLFEKLEGVEVRLSHIESMKQRLGVIEEQIEKHGEKFQEVDKIKHKAIGAAWLGGIGTGIIGWILK